MRQEKLKPENTWLQDPLLQRVLAGLNDGDGEARIVGGAVRNALLGQPISDIDIATTSLPQETLSRAKAMGFHCVTTGLAYGTVTIIAEGRPFEVTTLRRDQQTDGRHAEVSFEKAWDIDANRRDFTINAIYLDKDGWLYDYVGGLDDIDKGLVRFIGAADKRIEEDYLRILRFFRIYAYYGKGAPDKEGLKAIIRHKAGLRQLSAERVWQELKKILKAPDPIKALLWMRQSGVLSQELVESEKWGIDLIHYLIKAEEALHRQADALVRLAAIIPPDESRIYELSRRLKLSNAEKKRLLNYAHIAPVVCDTPCTNLQLLLYRYGRATLCDKLVVSLAQCLQRAERDNADRAQIIESFRYKIRMVEEAEVPVFALKGKDLMALGHKRGPQLGKNLALLEQKWIDSQFKLTKEQLLALLDGAP